jgi:predicted phosphate transport protein (TIGR00153 family)
MLSACESHSTTQDVCQQGGFMRIPLISKDKTSTFKEIETHAEKIKECTWSFQQALECYWSKPCDSFEEHRQNTIRLVNEAHVINNQIKDHISSGTKLPVSGFQLFMYLREQTQVVSAVENALEWISFRSSQVVPHALEKDFFLLFDAVIDPVEELVKMVTEARKYFNKNKRKQRDFVLNIITGMSKMEQDANKIEAKLKKRIFSTQEEPVGIFHLIRLTEIVASISDHAKSASDIMGGMLSS